MWQLILHLYYTLSLLHIHLFFSALPPAQIGLRNVDLNLILENLAKKVDQTILENEIEAWVNLKSLGINLNFVRYQSFSGPKKPSICAPV